MLIIGYYSSISWSRLGTKTNTVFISHILLIVFPSSPVHLKLPQLDCCEVLKPTFTKQNSQQTVNFSFLKSSMKGRKCAFIINCCKGCHRATNSFVERWLLPFTALWILLFWEVPNIINQKKIMKGNFVLVKLMSKPIKKIFLIKLSKHQAKFHFVWKANYLSVKYFPISQFHLWRNKMIPSEGRYFVKLSLSLLVGSVEKVNAVRLSHKRRGLPN